MSYTYRRLGSEEVSSLKQLNRVFGVAFGEVATYQGNPPTDEYLLSLLSDKTFIALVSLTQDGEVVGGLVAYELRKFEQMRSEMYIYDLAVAEAHRRKGVATALIGKLKKIAKATGAYVIFVQADGVDTGAVELYTKMSSTVEYDVIHFDILVP